MGVFVKWQPSEGPPQMLGTAQLADISMLSTHMLERIISVTVEGSELETLGNKVFSAGRERFPSIPWCYKARRQTWYGDHARFIVANCF